VSPPGPGRPLRWRTRAARPPRVQAPGAPRRPGSPRAVARRGRRPNRGCPRPPRRRSAVARPPARADADRRARPSDRPSPRFPRTAASLAGDHPDRPSRGRAGHPRRAARPRRRRAARRRCAGAPAAWVRREALLRILASRTHSGAWIAWHQSAGGPSAALRSAAMSILRIPSIACIARWARPRSGSANSSSIPVGTTCQDRPNRSSSQPHGPCSSSCDSRSE